MIITTNDQFNELIAQAKNLSELTQALVDATKALSTTPPTPGDVFTDTEINEVLAENDKFVSAIKALKNGTSAVESAQADLDAKKAVLVAAQNANPVDAAAVQTAQDAVDAAQKVLDAAKAA